MSLADRMNTPVKADKSAILERDRKSVHQFFELVEAMAGRASTATHDEMENGIDLEGGVLKADARGLCFRLTGPLGEADSHDVVGAALSAREPSRSAAVRRTSRSERDRVERLRIMIDDYGQRQCVRLLVDDGNLRLEPQEIVSIPKPGSLAYAMIRADVIGSARDIREQRANAIRIAEILTSLPEKGNTVVDGDSLVLQLDSGDKESLQMMAHIISSIRWDSINTWGNSFSSMSIFSSLSTMVSVACDIGSLEQHEKVSINIKDKDGPWLVVSPLGDALPLGMQSLLKPVAECVREMIAQEAILAEPETASPGSPDSII